MGAHVPERVMTNDEIATFASRRPTSGSRPAPASASAGSRPTASRRPASAPRRPSGRSRAPGMSGADLDLIVTATASPDYYFPATATLIGERIGAPRGGRVRPLGGLHRVRLRAGPGLRPARRGPGRHRARGRHGGLLAPARLGRPLDVRALRRRRGRRGAAPGTARRAGSWASSSAPTARARELLEVAAAGHSTEPAADARTCAMDGAQVYKFATTVSVDSATRALDGGRPDRRGRRRVRPAPGQPAHHRPRRPAARAGRGPGRLERRQVRQHVGRVDPDLPRRGAPVGPHQGRATSCS